MKKLPLHTQIIIGLVLGLLFGLASIQFGWDPTITAKYIKPFGTIFVNSLKMIAVPLVLASLIVGVANLGDVSKLSRMGGKTIITYLATTTIAITIGLILVNIVQPGKKLPESTRENLMTLYSGDVENRQGVAQDVRDAGPLQSLVDIVPQNVFEAFSDNGAMLKVVFVALIIGVALLHVPRDKGQPVIAFFDGLNDVII
mgnify:FL=1